MANNKVNKRDYVKCEKCGKTIKGKPQVWSIYCDYDIYCSDCLWYSIWNGMAANMRSENGKI